KAEAAARKADDLQNLEIVKNVNRDDIRILIPGQEALVDSSYNELRQVKGRLFAKELEFRTALAAHQKSNSEYYEAREEAQLARNLENQPEFDRRDRTVQDRVEVASRAAGELRRLQDEYYALLFQVLEA